MLKLPHYALKVTPIDGTHPYIKEALRTRGVNEKCWCGSNRKYKKCHQKRGSERAATLGELLHKTEEILWQTRVCMHPNAGSTTCSGGIIDAHTIQRKGALEKIIDSDNHVCVLKTDKKNAANEESLKIETIGWKKASTFPGFCGKHDTMLFTKIETTPFTGTHEQCVIQSYRALCNELYKKRSLVDTLLFQRENLDKGRDINIQIRCQLSTTENLKGQRQSVKELEDLQPLYETAIQTGDFSAFQSVCFYFDGDFGIVSTSIPHAEFAFDGKKVTDLWDLSVKGHAIAHSVMTTATGGAFFFCWEAECSEAQQVIDSFLAISDELKPDIFVQYCFLNCENTYFSRSWWDGLPVDSQKMLKKLMSLTYYEGGSFTQTPSGPLVEWKITGTAPK